MKLAELHDALASLGDQLQEMETLLSVDQPKDHEGFLLHDGSDLHDALLTLRDATSVISRLCFRLGREGVEP